MEDGLYPDSTQYLPVLVSRKGLVPSKRQPVPSFARQRKLIPSILVFSSSFIVAMYGACHHSNADQPSCPPEMARVQDFCIDRWEDTLEGALGIHNQAIATPEQKTRAIARSLQGVRPTVGISWYQARAACDNAGKHLCTYREWRSACSMRGSRYPWGDTPPVHERCAVAKADGTQTVFELQPTGHFPECKSPEGVYDLLGNAWDWIDPQRVDSKGRPVTGKMGSSFYSGQDARCASRPFDKHPPDFDGTIAARCCLTLETDDGWW